MVHFKQAPLSQDFGTLLALEHVEDNMDNKPHLKKRRFVPVIILVVLVVGFLGMGAMKRPPSRSGSTDHSIPAGTTYTVTKRTEGKTVEVSGNVEAIETVDLGFPRDGRIKAIMVKEGDRVIKGQVLAELYHATQLYQIASTRSTIEKTRISGSIRDLADLELKLAAELEDLDTFRILSTINGRVSDVEGSPGEIFQVGQASTAYVIRVIDDSRLVSEVKIDEIDAPLIRIGQKVNYVFDALEDVSVAGRVVSLPIEGIVDASGIAKVNTYLEVIDPPDQLLSGFSFTAEIIVSEGSTILVLDEKAIRQNKDRYSVTRIDDAGNSVEQDVTIEKRSDGTVRILSGLSAGDTILSAAKSTEKSSGIKNPLELLGLKAPEGGGPGSGGPGGGASSGANQ